LSATANQHISSLAVRAARRKLAASVVVRKSASLPWRPLQADFRTKAL
jgi:hypothetical protein